MKRLLLLSFLFLTVLHTTAQNVLNVHSKTGAVVSYALSQKPVVTYDGDVLVLTADKTRVEYPLADLDKLTFSDTESTVESISASGISGDRTIRIFDAEGRSVKTIESDAETDTEPQLLLRDLPEGIYIVRQGDISYKLIKE